MSDKRTSKIPKQLISHFHTHDPFKIAEGLGITVLKRYDFKRQKGAFKIILNNSFIFINGNLSEESQHQICGHELGHALLHRSLGMQDEPYLEFEIYDIKNGCEYDANVFSANLLIDEDELHELLYAGYDVVSIARELKINVNLLLIKLNEMNKGTQDMNLPLLPHNNFMGKITDDAGARLASES